MNSERRWSRRALLAQGAGAVGALAVAGVAAEPVQPGAQLVADGIPRFEPHRLASSDAQAPALRFLGWHPLRAEMLVLMRHAGSQQLHRVHAAGAKPQALTSGRDGVADAAWEPAAGEYLVFTRDQGGDEAWRLYRLDAGANEALAISPAGERVSEFEFLPQGAGLVYLQEQLSRDDAAASAAHSRLWWLDAKAAQPRRLLAESRAGRYTGLRISAGGRIVVTLTQNKHSQALLVALDGSAPRALGAARSDDDDETALAPDQAAAASEHAASAPSASSASAAPSASAASAHGAADLLWRRQAVHGEFRHLVSLDARTGERRNWLTQAGADLEGLAVPEPADGRPLALVYNRDGVSSLEFYDGAGAAPRIVKTDLPVGVLRNPRWHARLPLLGFDHVSADSPGRLFVCSLHEQRLTPWSAPAAGAHLQTRVLRWSSFDGLQLSGLHIAPPARFTGRRPVYISIHGGPSSQARPGFVAGVNRALAEQFGMHIIQPNVRGSDGYGKRFLKLDNGRLRENAVRDISALLDHIATRPDMDTTRVVVAGGSYGGYMSLAVATHESARILGSICRVGIANFVSFLEHTELYRRDNRRNEYGDEREPAMREFLQSISPLTRASAVKKPLFVVHGRNDPRVPYGEAQAMVRAVRAAGTPVWFLSALDEGHSFGKSANRDYLSQATLEFVQRLIEGRSVSA